MEWISNAKFGTPVECGSIYDLKENRNDVKLSIHQIHGLGDQWYLSCYTLNYDKEPLGTTSFNEAVGRARELIVERLEYLQALYRPFLNDRTETTFVRY